MYSFGKSSAAKLATVRPSLRNVIEATMALNVYDFTIVHGWRDEDVQNQAFLSGASTKQWPNSQHNITNRHGDPSSNAVDFAPWCMLPSGRMGIPWKDTHAFAVLGGMFIAMGAKLGIPIRYGGDWDMDGTSTDQTLMDWGHIEVLNK